MKRSVADIALDVAAPTPAISHDFSVGEPGFLPAITASSVDLAVRDSAIKQFGIVISEHGDNTVYLRTTWLIK